jgi:hypothetical protein
VVPFMCGLGDGGGVVTNNGGRQGGHQHRVRASVFDPGPVARTPATQLSVKAR